jgi:hypothetical protein
MSGSVRLARPSCARSCLRAAEVIAPCITSIRTFRMPHLTQHDVRQHNTAQGSAIARRYDGNKRGTDTTEQGRENRRHGPRYTNVAAHTPTSIPPQPTASRLTPRPRAATLSCLPSPTHPQARARSRSHPRPRPRMRWRRAAWRTRPTGPYRTTHNQIKTEVRVGTRTPIATTRVHAPQSNIPPEMPSS